VYVWGGTYKKCYIKNHPKSNERKHFIEHGKKINYLKYSDCEGNKVIKSCVNVEKLLAIFQIINVHMKKHGIIYYMLIVQKVAHLVKNCPSKYENNGNEQYISVHKE